MKQDTNTSGTPIEDIRTFKRFGSFLNHWRNRVVSVYEHPGDASQVFTIGEDMTDHHLTVCLEPYRDYASRIEHNAWHPYY